MLYNEPEGEKNQKKGKIKLMIRKNRKLLAPRLDWQHFFVKRQVLSSFRAFSRRSDRLESIENEESHDTGGVCVLAHNHSLEWHRLRLLFSVDYRRLVRRKANKNAKPIALKKNIQ